MNNITPNNETTVMNNGKSRIKQAPLNGYSLKQMGKSLVEARWFWIVLTILAMVFVSLLIDKLDNGDMKEHIRCIVAGNASVLGAALIFRIIYELRKPQHDLRAELIDNSIGHYHNEHGEEVFILA